MNSEYRIRSAQKTIRACAESIGSIELDEAFSDTVSSILDCNGKVVTTGMGKAGIAMKKFSAILCSFGVPSVYLHPAEASHGDSGIMSEEDILFVASTSGKTREVIETIEIAKKIGVRSIIGITSHSDSVE